MAKFTQQDTAEMRFQERLNTLDPLIDLAKAWDIAGLTAKLEAMDVDEAREAAAMALLLLVTARRP